MQGEKKHNIKEVKSLPVTITERANGKASARVVYTYMHIQSTNNARLTKRRVSNSTSPYVCVCVSSTARRII